MIQIKTFQTGFADGEAQKEINKWLKDNKIQDVVNVTAQPMHDLFQVDGKVCNQWVEWVVIYHIYM